MKNDPTEMTDEERATRHKKYLAEEAEREARTMRKIADVVDTWRYCDADDWRVCRRSRRCAGKRNPCFVKHKEEFYSVIRKYIIPDLKKRRGQGLYDPGPETVVVSGGFEPVTPGPARSAESRVSTSSSRKRRKDVDGRDKPGHDTV